MPYQKFQNIIDGIIRKSGEQLEVLFANDEEKGKYFAYITDGTIITGKRSSHNLTVNFGSGHTAMASV